MSGKKTLTWEAETHQDRQQSVQRGFRDNLYPPVFAQKRYSLSKFPCPRCEKGELPLLADHGGVEFYWEHRGRIGCPRFGQNDRGEKPREGTATSLWVKVSFGVLPWTMDDSIRHATRARTPAQYQQALSSGLAESYEDLLIYAHNGEPIQKLADALGYTHEEMKVIVRTTREIQNHYGHPNYDRITAAKAMIKGEVYDPSKGWDPTNV